MYVRIVCIVCVYVSNALCKCSNASFNTYIHTYTCIHIVHAPHIYTVTPHTTITCMHTYMKNSFANALLSDTFPYYMCIYTCVCVCTMWLHLCYILPATFLMCIYAYIYIYIHTLYDHIFSD